MRTQEINTASDWEAFLHNVTFALWASHHSMLNTSPTQDAFGRDMIADIPHKTDWAEQYQRKLDQDARNNKRERAMRREWHYAPGDRVLLKNDAVGLMK
ncbi:Pol protein [Phytophthora palmivora]|uniref:Pol protein n=1 Tax=Phytophthora palmivora TaxID=4796 RepID=A0A2P4XT49_9STRA|nr:Pol protein [Phytophthora palmivora]